MPFRAKDNVQLEAYKPLTLRETISYSLGDVGFNLYWAPLTAFLMIYLTDVVGLPMAQTGLLLVIMRLSGAVAEPVFAALADRTHTTYGRYRVWFLWLAVPLAAAGIMIFSTSGAPEDSKLVAVYISLITFNLIYTAITVPYNALSGVITQDSKQREILLSARYGIAFLTAVFLTWLTPKLVAFTGPHQIALGWQFAMTIYGVLAFAIFINLFLNTRERFSMVSEPNANPLNDVSDLFATRPWLILFGLGFMVMLAFTLHTAATPYFVKYVLKRSDLVTHFAMVFTLGLAAGSAITSTLTKWLARPRLISVMLAMAGMASLGLYLAPSAHIPLMFILQFCSAFALGTVSTLTFAMCADTADFTAWRTGHRATAMAYSLIMFAKKIGAALAAALIAWALSTQGFDANTPASPQLIGNIRLMIGLVPALLVGLGAILIEAYSLKPDAVARYQAEMLTGKRG